MFFFFGGGGGGREREREGGGGVLIVERRELSMFWFCFWGFGGWRDGVGSWLFWFMK